MDLIVEIDPNVRVRGNQTFASLSDASGDITVGCEVTAVEYESGYWWPAVVTEIDPHREIVYLAVEWNASERNA